MDDVRPATLDDSDLLASIAAAGFYDDPMFGWALRDDARRHDQLTYIFGGLAREMLPDRGVVHLAGGASAAFWRDPTFDHRTASQAQADAAGGPVPFSDPEIERLLAIDAALLEHHPHEPHWYLNVVSTVPTDQGRGLGTAVLQPTLERCDADGVRAYLESTNPRNLTLYRRNGFVDAGEIRIEGGPSLTKMWREPR